MCLLLLQIPNTAKWPQSSQVGAEALNPEVGIMKEQAIKWTSTARRNVSILLLKALFLHEDELNVFYGSGKPRQPVYEPPSAEQLCVCPLAFLRDRRCCGS